MKGRLMDRRISVVTPVKNRAKLIVDTIESFLNQNFQDFEMIIVDDHSIDNTIESILTIKDPRIKVISLPDEFGQGKACARNFGNIIACGEIIAVCDSDDLAEQERLKVIHDAFQTHSEAGIFYSDGEVRDEIAGIIRDRNLKWSEFDLLLNM